jgi:hypothetical protein
MCSDGILYPLELVSTRIAAGGKYKAVIPTIRTIMAEEGFKVSLTLLHVDSSTR